jgi:LPXTG-motif cell wall-anchored protein
MGRFLLALLALTLVLASRADAGGAPTASCCACKSSSDQTLFCAVILPGEEASADQKCDALSGSYLCKANMVGDRSCTFEGLDCPATGAPAMGGSWLGALVALLGAAGVFGLRRRAAGS